MPVRVAGCARLAGGVRTRDVSIWGALTPARCGSKLETRNSQLALLTYRPSTAENSSTLASNFWIRVHAVSCPCWAAFSLSSYFCSEGTHGSNRRIDSDDELRGRH